MKSLLVLMAVIEAATGLAMLAAPSLPVSLLVGVALEGPGALVAARVAGAALLAMALACWSARGGGNPGAARVVVAAMLFYNVAVGAVLVHANLWMGLSGVLLWPAVLLHMGVVGWCAVSLRTGD